MFWCQIGGHFRKIVSSKRGLVWGISYDNTAYYYMNGSDTNPMTDNQNYYIYENQRWNPLTGMKKQINFFSTNSLYWTIAY